MGSALLSTERTAPTDTGFGPGETTIPARASAYLADPRGLASRAEQGSPAVQAGGPPGAYESPSQEAHQSAPRTGTTGDGSGAILGNGFRTRRADKRQEVSSIDGHRQVASPVCRATSGLCANWAKCRGRTERSSLRTRSTVCDNCRSWNGIYVKNTRRVVLLPSRDARFHSPWEADGKRHDRIVQRPTAR